jgi:hypothetical protein
MIDETMAAIFVFRNRRIAHAQSPAISVATLVGIAAS